MNTKKALFYRPTQLTLSIEIMLFLFSINFIRRHKKTPQAGLEPATA